jgi:hypothetical protein
MIRLPAANRTPSRTLQTAHAVLHKSHARWKKGPIYKGFFNIALTKSFAMFRREAE